jgi:2,4-dienoyl-CoA reductase-like NADH-dependent reductase (Old Yellow Enzyme family)
MTKLEHIFAPLTVKGMTLRNRIVCPPMNPNYGSEEGFVTERMLAFYGRIARGGTGLVQVGACAISPDSLVTTNQIRADDDRYIDGLSRLFEVIKEAGAVSSVQLVHAGKLVHSPKLAPQAGPFPPGPILPIQPGNWSGADLVAVAEAFAGAARRIKRAGADMVTIHGAHHYLINELMSPYFNERTDEYGGSFQNRVRFAVQVIGKVRDAAGPAMPVIFRISGSDFLDGGLTLEENRKIVPLLVGAGADIIDVSAAGRVTYGSKGDRTFPSKKLGAACNVPLASGIKEVSQVPVICVGNIWDLKLADDILIEGKADLVAMGRALIADPSLVEKVKAGDNESIVECTRCSKCLYFLYGEMSMSCPLNADL